MSDKGRKSKPAPKLSPRIDIRVITALYIADCLPLIGFLVAPFAKLTFLASGDDCYLQTKSTESLTDELVEVLPMF
ncbi:MAG: hypothetical protein ABJ349_07025 [Hyphomicrobiales bacterium]